MDRNGADFGPGSEPIALFYPTQGNFLQIAAMIRFTRTRELFQMALTVFGFLVPSGIFVYVAFSRPGALTAALRNPIAEVFMAEAGILMLLFAWLIHRSGIKRPGWGLYLVMSLVGSMAFSVPMFLYMASREPGKKD